MAQYSNLKAYIEEKIYENGTQAITGDILQDVLKVMTDDLGEFYQMGGVASPSTDPGTPDAKVIYFATEAGTYTNFGDITIEAGEVALLIFETSWTKETLNVLSSANGGVKTANLADGAVTTEKIAGGAVETAKIANNAVTSGKVADGAIGATKIADGAIAADKIAANAVESAKIKNGAVTEGKINDGAVTAGKVAANAVTTAKIADEAVTTAKLNDGAVTEDKIATDAVTSGKVKDGAIGTAKIAAGAVTHAKIGAGAVEESNIKDGAVTSDKIANGAVGSDQLAEGAFSAENLADGSVTTDKLADNAVTAEKIADGAVTAGKFANGSVTTIKLGSGAVTTEKIGDGMVTRQKLADSSVGTSKIIDGAVTTDKVADGAITDAKLENPVSVSQNTETGKTELLIGDTPALIVDNEPVAGSDNLVKSGGVAYLFYGNISDLYIDGKFVNGSGGIADDSNYIISSDIPVKEGDSIVWNPGIINISIFLVVYDSNGQKVGGNFSASSTTRTCVLTDYQGASFIRATFAKSNLSNAKLIVNGEQVWHARTTEKKDGVYNAIEVLSNFVETNANNITNETNRAQGAENTLNRNILELNQDIYGNNNILYIDGKCVNNEGGIVTNENCLITSHIPVQIGDTIIWNHGLNNDTTKALIVYDSSGNKVGSSFSATGNTRTCVITDSFVNASYIIATFAKSNIDNAKIIINDVEVWRPLTTVETTGLKEDFYNIKEDFYNLFNEINGNYGQYYAEGEYIGSEGEIVTNELWGRTGKIPVSEGDIVDWNHCRTQDTSNQRFLVVYDSEGQKIGANFASTGSKRTCDLAGYVGASYLMASFELDGINDAFIKINDKEVWKPVTQEYKNGLVERVTALEENPFDINDVIIRNTDKIYPLINACQLHRFTNTSKDLQLSILADVHGYVKPTEHAVKITNGFDTIDAMIAVGDILAQSFTGSFIETYKNFVLNSDKPIYSLMGNHDVGNSKYVGICASHAQIYQTFIEPMIQKGWLVSGEYVQNTGYWYHDFVDNNKGIKVRLIALYEYDDNLDLANSDYWEPVTYNSEYSELQFNTSYSVNDYVNCGNYTDYSFKCKQALTTPANAYTNQSLLPCYIVQRGTRVIRQAQAQWFLNTLYNTPNDYTIVVALHNPFSDSAVLYTDSIFCQNIPNVTGASFSQNSMETDFIADAVAAFVNRENYSVNVVMKGNASYLNTEGGGTYAYNVSKDFSQKADNSKFLCYLGGHTHRDLVFKKDGFYQISPITASLGHEYGGSIEQFDIRREYSNGENVDSLTVISFDTRFNSVGLVKVGANMTNNLLRRDMERLNM